MFCIRRESEPWTKHLYSNILHSTQAPRALGQRLFVYLPPPPPPPPENQMPLGQAWRGSTSVTRQSPGSSEWFCVKPTCFVIASRAAEEAFVNDIDESSPGTEWERVARLCDFNPKSSKQAKDVSRMRSVLISLKQAPLVHWRAHGNICNILILLSEALHSNWVNYVEFFWTKPFVCRVDHCLWLHVSFPCPPRHSERRGGGRGIGGRLPAVASACAFCAFWK